MVKPYSSSDLQYILILQYIDIVNKYHDTILIFKILYIEQSVTALIEYIKIML